MWGDNTLAGHASPQGSAALLPAPGSPCRIGLKLLKDSSGARKKQEMATQRDGGCMRGVKGGRHHPTTLASRAGAHGSVLQPMGAFESVAVGLMWAALCGALGPQSCVNFLTDGVCRRVRGSELQAYSLLGSELHSRKCCFLCFPREILI